MNYSNNYRAGGGFLLPFLAGAVVGPFFFNGFNGFNGQNNCPNNNCMAPVYYPIFYQEPYNQVYPGLINNQYIEYPRRHL